MFLKMSVPRYNPANRILHLVLGSHLLNYTYQVGLQGNSLDSRAYVSEFIKGELGCNWSYLFSKTQPAPTNMADPAEFRRDAIAQTEWAILLEVEATRRETDKRLRYAAYVAGLEAERAERNCPVPVWDGEKVLL